MGSAAERALQRRQAGKQKPAVRSPELLADLDALETATADLIRHVLRLRKLTGTRSSQGLRLPEYPYWEDDVPF